LGLICHHIFSVTLSTLALAFFDSLRRKEPEIFRSWASPWQKEKNKRPNGESKHPQPFEPCTHQGKALVRKTILTNFQDDSVVHQLFLS
jgi:hypothetical protein